MDDVRRRLDREDAITWLCQVAKGVSYTLGRMGDERAASPEDYDFGEGESLNLMADALFKAVVDLEAATKAADDE